MAAGALHRLSDLRVVLEPRLCDGLQLGERVALPQYGCVRGGLTHRLGDLGDQPGERFTEGHPRRLPVGATNRLGNLEQAKRRRFPLFDAERQLVRDGYRLRIYIPYGQDWFPYFMRRLAERPANLAFFARNFFR